MSGTLLIDTDILIDYLRDYQPAVEWLEALTVDLKLSAINVAEIYSGMREPERQKIETLLECFTIIPLDAALAESGGLLRRDFGKSHGTGLADAIIAATVQQLGCSLATLNQKHFPMLDSVIVPYHKK
ncbi:MAG: type II toxin-antitoxin system VapC family toxin [Candidatus Methylumidiphilus sp.]